MPFLSRNHLIPSFFAFLVILISIDSVSAQDVDTLLIRKYTYNDYSAGTTNYTGVAAENGIVYFGNSQGVLIYDGSTWELIGIGDDVTITALLLSGDTLYLGSNDEFGYLITTGENKFQYRSLISLLDEKESVDDVWQIKKTSDGIYFQSYNHLLFYDGKTIRPIDIKDSYIFNFADKLIASTFNGEVFLVSEDKIIDSLNIYEIAGDAGFSLLPIDKEHSLMFTSEHGGYIIKSSPFSISKWQSSINKKIMDDGIYHAVEYNDYYLCSTWDKGIILMTKEGKLVRQIDGEKGLPNRNLREIFVDSNDNIWIPSGDGIYQIRLSANKTVKSFVPQTIIKGISSELGAISQVNNIFNPAYIVFDYTTPGFNRDDLEYSFYLEGYDDDWTPWTNIYRKEYTNLKHGEYTFHLKSRTSGADNTVSRATFNFGIVLPWSKRPSIYLGAIFLIILITGIIMGIRTKELQNAKTRLESVVIERTQELVEEKEKLKEANKELEISNTELDNFVYRSSHDLIAPLKSLRGLMSITKMETQEEHLLNYIAMMETSVLKLESFISSIMEYSINANAGAEINEININTLLDEITEDIKYFDNFDAIEFLREIDEEYLTTDYKRLKIILSNLITNAIKYHKLSHQNPFVKITGLKENDNYIIKVSDNGNGISQEHVDKIFDMFYRASVESEGSGLGLYIVQETIKKLGGKIQIKSEEGKGSTFIITLPAS